jgi:DNA topoisomerase I
MPKNLLIVESPAKAKTIEKYLGKDFTVKSSYGHIRDLAKGNSAVDVANNFQLQYIIPDDKKKLVNELKSLVKQYDDVWLATDEDREGEAISWHLCEVLGLDEKTTKRIVFREITKTALQAAITSPRLLDIHLVNAQQARRVLDRLVGFELSSLVWRKVAGGSGLSAGRVQSVAVKLIVEREREVQEFEAKPFFRVGALFYAKNHLGRKTVFKAELPKKYDTEKEANVFLNQCVNATYQVEDINVRPTKRSPAAPFTTSTLQQEASRKLGFSVTRTMSNAQRLYEAGHISYMRTDSTNLSQTAIQSIAATITKEYGSQYLQSRAYTKKNSELSQEAHEAIRPTDADKQVVVSDYDQQRLYELIWKRTVASQMADAQIEKTTAKIGISTLKDAKLAANGEVIKFDGFLKVYLESTDDDEQEEDTGMLPPLKVGQVLDLQQMNATERFTRAVPRFTEASLVKKLEELGIGRPSTYAPTISKITEKGRGYVVKENREGTERKYQVLTLENNKVSVATKTEITGAEKNKLFPSDKGKLVCDFLSEHFDKIMDYGFTAEIEKRFDKIANGSIEWNEMLKTFYTSFHKRVQTTLKEAERASGERILGKDEESGKTVLVRMSRNGALVQIGTNEELGDEKPRYANLKPTMSIETVTLQEVLDLFKLPITVGEYEGKEVIINEGRFGPYVFFDEKYISLDRGEEPMSVTLSRAIELIETKRKEDAPVATYQGLPVQQGSGRFGAFLKWNNIFINIPSRYNPDALSKNDIDELIAAKIEKEANRVIKSWEAENIAIENARWGPLVKFKTKKINIPKKEDGKRVTAEEAQEMTLEEVKAIIMAEVPNAFSTPAAKAKATPKKPAAKKPTTTKKATTTKKK